MKQTPKVGNFLFYCREGYEADLAAELDDYSANINVFGYSQLAAKQAHVRFHVYEHTAGNVFNLNKLIFARQAIAVLGELNLSNPNDRISDVLEFLSTHEGIQFGDVLVEYPETEDGKQMAKFCKKFTVPLRQALRKRQILSAKHHRKLPYLHLFMQKSDACIVGYSLATNRSEHLLGIHRLKFPADAPSRSTLKLEEAITTFLSTNQQQQVLQKGMSAVDLGACPGGWTYQMVTRGIRVEAIDNGAMDDKLMATGLVKYHACDGFKYRPEEGHVDWLICDMIEKPELVAELMADWIEKRWTSSAIFNLKLPMKKRFSCVQTILQQISERLQGRVQNIIKVKHLYHDRDEVTVIILAGNHFTALQNNANTDTA